MDKLICATILVLVVFKPVNSISSDQMEKIAKAMRNACLQKVDTTVEMVDGLRKGQFPDDPDLKCYTLCVLKAMRSYKNGAIDFNMVLKQIDMTLPEELAPRMKSIINKCSQLDIKGEPCDMTYNYVKCCYETDPEVFFFP